MNVTTPSPTAGEITVAETLALLEGPFSALASGLAGDQYALWLGSGISLARFPGLPVLVRKVLEFLYGHSAKGDPECRYRNALGKAVEIAGLRREELEALDLDQPLAEWPALDHLVDGLVERYQDLLAIQVDGEDPDYLLWEAVDVRGTYGVGIEPDCEHICLAILVLEGAVTEVVSANWDGLIEAALAELGGDPDDILRVVVLPAELRSPRRDLLLLKFHGCAVLASSEPDKYRRALVASAPQILAWNTNGELKPIREKMIELASTKRTLMVGLSARDVNIKALFAEAKEALPWRWPVEPPAHVFADETLTDSHTTILQMVYGEDYSENAEEIEDQALIRAFGKPLLTALVIFVLVAKLRAYLAMAETPQLSVEDREQLAGGLSELGRRLAGFAEGGRLEFVRQLVADQRRALSLFRMGSEPTTGTTTYERIGNPPPDRVKTDSALATNGVRELAAGLALLGRGEAADSFSLARGPLPTGTAGALKVLHGGRESAVFFAANGRAALQLHSSGILDPAAGDIVIIHSTEPVERAVRSPRGRYGRNGRPPSREVDMSELLRTASDLTTLEEEFRQAAAL